ncbi:hypothetical protein V2P20_11925 [Methylobacter sp. Wu1]|uniref:hypothetical protein n=1 Tax=Methylobacter sp. Wu1 TaxID=3119359 RepID=UPI002F939FFB
MPLFISLSLAFSFIVQSASPLQSLLESTTFNYTGITLAVCSIAGIVLKKLPPKICYDVFASGALLAWFSHWKPLFNDDSPIFFFYPLYFAFMMAFVSLFFIQRPQVIDYDTFRYIKYVSRKYKLPPWLVMAGVLVSLALHQHFLLFPIMMTLLIIRFALTSYLEQHLTNRL